MQLGRAMKLYGSMRGRATRVYVIMNGEGAIRLYGTIRAEGVMRGEGHETI